MTDKTDPVACAGQALGCGVLVMCGLLVVAGILWAAGLVVTQL